ncbi:MAG: hypothetical protein ACK5AZ_26845 [Bryobacteraceae bacterium]
MPKALRSGDVFVNCPFDDGYKPIFEAIGFAVHDIGFVARCALEEDDASEQRFSKIERIIEQCRFGIHDLSAVELDRATCLPHFNMPFELGVFLGCKRFGGDAQRQKVTLILDADRYRYRTFISDLSASTSTHGGRPEQAIREVRNWLAVDSRRKLIPGGTQVVGRYERFRAELPSLCAEASLNPTDLTFRDLSDIIATWLKTSR